MPTFSIIVPVHNGEQTLCRCLDSLVAQTFSDFEVLMIENGSQDSSNAICRRYADRDNRFHLHTCDGPQGPSGARNIGLDNAQGSFVTFVDSDDFVASDYLHSLHQHFAQADVVFFGYYQISHEGTLIKQCVPTIPEDLGYYETLVQLAHQDMFGYTWIKAFRRETIGEHRFSRELNLMEDEVFTCEVLTVQRRIAVLSAPVYSYVTGNAGSLMGRTHPDYCRKADAVYIAWKNLLEHYHRKDEILMGQASVRVSQCMYYGFERDINVQKFFHLLSECEFFKAASLNTPFYTHVKNQNFSKLSHMRTAYRAKQSLAKLLKK